MADIPYGRDYPDPIWCDEDGQPMPPVGAELLDDIRAFLRRFVVYPSDHELIAHTLWIAHCWFMEAWDSTPRIAFLSPEPGSGKSRALEVTEPLVPRPVHAINCTPAYLFRRVADPVGRPTVLYDECDTLFGPKAKEHEEIRGVINAGHRKGAVAGRCVIRGKIVETEELPAYCAVALAGLDDLPDTIMSRSIVVRMRRRAPTEPVEPWRPRVNGPEAEKLHDRLANWAAAINPLESGWPAMPDGVTDRRADVWESLVAVADTAGGHWPQNRPCNRRNGCNRKSRSQAQHRRAAAAGYPSSLQRPGPDAHQRHPDRTEPDGGGTVGLHPPRRPARRARPRDPARQIRHRAEVPAQWWRTTLQRVFADPVRGCVVPVSLCRRRNPRGTRFIGFRGFRGFTAGWRSR